jgi:hypothetical protein
MNTRQLKHRLYRRLEDGRRFFNEERFVGNKCARALSLASILPLIILCPEVGIPLFCLFNYLLLINQRLEHDDDFSEALILPTNSQSETTFFQKPLINHINEIAPKRWQTKENGMCYGFLRIWHCYDHFGWEDKFFHEIKKLRNTSKLSAEQKYFLQSLQVAQNSQNTKKMAFHMHIEGKTVNMQKTRTRKISVAKEKNITTAIKEIVEEALKLALANLGALVELGIYEADDDGHSLGIIAHSDLMGLTIKYFDPNERKENFGTLQDANESIFNFINYDRAYYSWLNKAKAKSCSRVFDLQVYKVKNSKKISALVQNKLEAGPTEMFRPGP